MNGVPSAVWSHMEQISIQAVRDWESELMQRCFSPAERQDLACEPLQTIAGRLALKRAICRLAAQRFGASTLQEADVELQRTPNGAPAIVRVTLSDRALRNILENDLYVSISHSRKSAVGIAVILRSQAVF
jgi:phosphopantetheine--protein transferase-like protein